MASCTSPPAVVAAPAERCSALAASHIANLTIHSATVVRDSLAGANGGAAVARDLPSFCRVVGSIAPTTDSDIRFELWLPLESWNGKFAGVGNGGWAGPIAYPALAAQLRRGYATVSTNTGHDPLPGFDMARFVYQHPERLIDFAYRSQHETTVVGKTLTAAFYGRQPTYSYWIGCSSGGKEGLMEAQRFPADYDGIVAGAPANNWTRLEAAELDATLAGARDTVYTLSPAALRLLNRTVLDACDKLDGVIDGVIEDPRACHFDPASVQCARTPRAACLSAEQVEVARRLYRGPTDPRTGKSIYPGLALGSEPGWPAMINPAAPLAIPIAHYRWLVFADPSWDWKTFDWNHPADYAAFQRDDSLHAPILSAINPDLRAFERRGGKLIQYHGWADQIISPFNSIDYFESVVSFVGSNKSRTAALDEVEGFYRLFMVPGMAHCGGGPGPTTFDMLAVLERWREQGIPPASVDASHVTQGKVDRTRTLCPYPKVAVYNGSGDANAASSFSCRDAG